MDFSIISEIPGRSRIKLAGPVPQEDLDSLIKVASALPGITSVKVYGRIGQMAVTYEPNMRKTALDALTTIDAEAIEQVKSTYTMDLAPRSNALLMDLAMIIGGHFSRRWFLPAPLRTIFTAIHFWPFLREGLRALVRGKLTVPVLDASAIGISFVKKQPKTAGETMLLLRIGETLENYTKAVSENELINSLLDVPDKAQKVEGDTETSVPTTSLVAGDLIAVRTGMSICIDGVVEKGVAMVNQATLTGEPLAVERTVGDDVFAGTVVEEGEILIRVRQDTSATKLRSIVSLVENANELKSEGQSRMERMADKIVPWNFLLAGIVALTTRSLIKTSAALMVDYSCALKLTGSLAVMTAMSNAAREGMMVKGAKHFETFGKADTIVFDKTGTLTEATPKLNTILTTEDWTEDEILRLAACLEEHFPHPVARAIVHGAEERNLEHRERHAEVEYIVAHGLVSSLEGKRVLIGSAHFVINDEGATIPEKDLETIQEKMQGLSPLYLAVDGKVVGVLGVHDPLKPNVAEVVSKLKELGFEHVVMLTGDSYKTAERIAAEAGISEFGADLLPEDKYAYLEKLKAEGHTIAMVGDGINDSPALNLADVGLAMGQGSDIAKEVADIVLSDGDLYSLVKLRLLSAGLTKRLTSSFRNVMAFNSGLLALGIAGIVTPQTSSLLHNASTIGFSLNNTKAYLPSKKNDKKRLPKGEAEGEANEGKKPARKKPARKASARKKPVAKTSARKASETKKPAEKPVRKTSRTSATKGRTAKKNAAKSRVAKRNTAKSAGSTAKSTAAESKAKARRSARATKTTAPKRATRSKQSEQAKQTE